MTVKLRVAPSTVPKTHLHLFFWVWFGQLISNIGTQLTLFAFGVSVYQQSQSVTQFALMILAIYLPPILMAPLAGHLADHYQRRLIMILSDTGAIAGILLLGWLLQFEALASWQIYLLLGISSAFNSLQVPAYLAATTLMVPRTFLSQANGLILIGHSVAQLVAPFTAAWLILSLQLPGIILLDCLSFGFILITLLMVRFPEIAPPARSQSPATYLGLIQETLWGWHYIQHRPGLLALLLLISITYATLGMTEVLFTPFVLSFATTKELGALLSMAGGGWVVGSVVVSFWRDPPRLVLPIIGGVLVQGWVLLGAGGEWTIKIFPVCVGGIVAYCLVCPLILSFNQTLWQEQVEPEYQGQVFATRLAIEWSFRLITLVLAGPLVDRLFEPFFRGDYWFLDQVGWLTGRGEGRGIAALLSIMGAINLLGAIAAYRYTPLLRLDSQTSH